MSADTRTLPVRFTGAGRQYFGIWIVNLLLLMLTVGLYYPWARVRKLQYFADHTEIGGYPMHFHGVAIRMFGGFLVAAVAFVLYVFAEQIHPAFGLLMVVAFAAVWPALLRGALRFRLGHTSWRGIRLAFTGGLGEAYRSVGVPLLGTLALAVLIAVVAGPFVPLDEAGIDETLGGFARMAAIALAAFSMLLLPVAPYLHYRIIRYRQSNLRLAGEHTGFQAGALAFYWLYGATGLMAAAVGLAASLLVVLPMAAAGVFGGGLGEDDAAAFGALVVVGGLLVLFPLYHALRAFYEARLFNLVWHNTASEHLQGNADLSFWRLWRLRMANSLLIGITLGLYIPFATVRIARLQRESLSIDATIDPDTLLDAGQRSGLSAASDAAADLFDIDIGL